MLFNSYEFIFAFLPFTFFIYFYLNKKRLTKASNFFLVASSLFFYSWWNPIYLPLILISMIFNYVIGTSLTKNKEYRKVSKKQLLTIAIVANIALLGYFKYSDFFISNVNFVLGTEIALLCLALPLAISFFTFQQIAYLVDSYRGKIKEYDFMNYAIFVTFFPQLIAGPIVHHKEMMPQFANVRNKVINYKNIAFGLFIFSIGLFKKVVMADTFAVWATAGFDEATTLSLFEAWATSLSYTFQLYFDFSGYTDMAIGAALLFNIKLPINFNSPYKATDIQDFWRRWHITLTRFLREYIYIPLGGNRKGNFRTYINLMAIFIIGGFWHGAGWTFIFWGFLHGFALVLHRAWSSLGFKLYTWLAWLVTFNFVNIAWVFFRAKEWDDALKVLSGMLGLSGINLPNILSGKLAFLNHYGIEFGNFVINIKGDNFTPLWLLFGFILILVFRNTNQRINRFRLSKDNIIFYGVLCGVFLFVGVMFIGSESEFLYFNF
ncbi:membrane-bound O-acyltransferase family protein [Malaciobacter mytili LMG 24559]|uniref:Membrane-bound O-acyltransferase family protein n=1 Tax=Malaciobacter mytili LMG 24559 TaxID=1032238 RepID=A0AAX2ADT3_9BACT|nr:MBOAT family protein [Malaciobacter mytili]AXH14157.1 membrane-bound O-acyl transferase, MBOAT family [Malaciobacter mytili LMG 24559]RXK15152.1 membrane-bound O-acyltransferase family protein [Malaciobacter mytili LMG 24559]